MRALGRDDASYTARQFGAKGVVVDGGTRDREGLVAIPDWPVFARYTTPIESKKRWRSLEFQAPIFFVTGTLTSEVRVEPGGTCIVGDPDGVLVVPKTIAHEVLLAVERIEENEEGTRRDLADGLPVAESIATYGRHANYATDCQSCLDHL